MFFLRVISLQSELTLNIFSAETNAPHSSGIENTIETLLSFWVFLSEFTLYKSNEVVNLLLLLRIIKHIATIQYITKIIDSVIVFNYKGAKWSEDALSRVFWY